MIMWLYVILSAVLMIFFFPSLLFAPFTCCYLCRRYCERDFNYALLLRDKREHPEKYQDETAETEEDEEDIDEDLYEEYEIDEEDDDLEEDPDDDADEDEDLEEDVKDDEVCQVDDYSPSE